MFASVEITKVGFTPAPGKMSVFGLKREKSTEVSLQVNVWMCCWCGETPEKSCYCCRTWNSFEIKPKSYRSIKTFSVFSWLANRFLFFKGKAK